MPFVKYFATVGPILAVVLLMAAHLLEGKSPALQQQAGHPAGAAANYSPHTYASGAYVPTKYVRIVPLTTSAPVEVAEAPDTAAAETTASPAAAAYAKAEEAKPKAYTPKVRPVRRAQPQYPDTWESWDGRQDSGNGARTNRNARSRMQEGYAYDSNRRRNGSWGNAWPSGW